MKYLRRLIDDQTGMTLVEVMLAMLMLGVVMIVITGVFISSHHLYGKTNRRANMQMNARLGLGIMTREIRQAGCDPAGLGIPSVAYATGDTLRIQSDLDGDGTLATAEPSEDVTYFFDSNAQVLFRDPGSGPQVLVKNVRNMAIVYRDANDNVLAPLPLTPEQTARIRSVSISMTARGLKKEEYTLTTRIALRNS